MKLKPLHDRLLDTGIKPFGEASFVTVAGHVARTAPNGAFYVELDNPKEVGALIATCKAPAEFASEQNYDKVTLGFTPSNVCVYDSNSIRPYRGEPMESIGLKTGASVNIIWRTDGEAAPKVVVEQTPTTLFGRLKNHFWEQ